MSDSTIEQRCAEQVRDHRGQTVVVAERGFQLIDADRVVFVDDRHRAEVEQRVQRVADVEIANAVIDVFDREQHLRGAAAVFGKRAVVSLNQMRLADGRDGLQLGQIGRRDFQAQQADARADRAAADQHHAPAAAAESHESPRQAARFADDRASRRLASARACRPSRPPCGRQR